MGAAQGRVQEAAANAAAGAAVDAAGRELRYKWPQCAYLSVLRTALGYLAVFGVWSAALQLLISAEILKGIFLLILAIPITLLELSWIFNKLTFCVSEGSPIGKIRRYLEILDSWKRGVFYGMAAMITMIPMPFIGVYSILVGLLLMVVAILYCAKAFQFEEVTAADTAPPPYTPTGAGGQVPPMAGRDNGGMQDPTKYNQVP